MAHGNRAKRATALIVGLPDPFDKGRVRWSFVNGKDLLLPPRYQPCGHICRVRHFRIGRASSVGLPCHHPGSCPLIRLLFSWSFSLCNLLLDDLFIRELRFRLTPASAGRRAGQTPQSNGTIQTNLDLAAPLRGLPRRLQLLVRRCGFVVAASGKACLLIPC